MRISLSKKERLYLARLLQSQMAEEADTILRKLGNPPYLEPGISGEEQDKWQAEYERQER
jgi:hypothetical protein